jgi:formate dehydrogenase subunit gamma
MSRSDRRFSPSEVVVHTTFAALVLVGIATAAVLYVDSLSVLVGRRSTVATVHLWAGLLIPVPLAAGLLSRSFRADVRSLEAWSPDDSRWLRSRDRRSGAIPVDRFNAGQKLNAALTVGAIIVLLGTGAIMGSLLGAWPDDLRTGATFVHDWTAFGLTAAVTGHVWFAVKYRRGDAVKPATVDALDPGRPR